MFQTFKCKWGFYVEFPEKSFDNRNDQLSLLLTKTILGKNVNKIHVQVES